MSAQAVAAATFAYHTLMRQASVVVGRIVHAALVGDTRLRKGKIAMTSEQGS